MKIYPQVVDYIVKEAFKIWIEEYFLQYKTNNEYGCWEWNAGLNTGGYGSLRSPVTRKTMQAHIYSYAVYNNKLDKNFDHVVDLLVLHRCNNRKCINPQHLYEGTYRDNHEDARKACTTVITNSILDNFTLDQIIAWRKAGLTSKDISKKVGISPRGVRNFICRKERELGIYIG